MHTRRQFSSRVIWQLKHSLSKRIFNFNVNVKNYWHEGFFGGTCRTNSWELNFSRIKIFQDLLFRTNWKTFNTQRRIYQLRKSKKSPEKKMPKKAKRIALLNWKIYCSPSPYDYKVAVFNAYIWFYLTVFGLWFMRPLEVKNRNPKNQTPKTEPILNLW